VVLLAALPPAIGGCGDRAVRPEPVAANPPELFPLTPGTFWVYEVKDFEGHAALQRVVVRGPFYLKTRDTSGTVVEETGGVGEEMNLDVSWHPVVYYRRGDFLYKFYGISYDDQQLREYRIGRGEEKVLPSDPERNPQWESDFQVFELQPGNGYEIRSVSLAQRVRDPVTVRAGTFRNCIRVQTQTVNQGRDPLETGNILTFRYTDWYAPGIGLVKSLVEVPDAPRPLSSVELISFRAAD
jgi:hypothetical protein